MRNGEEHAGERKGKGVWGGGEEFFSVKEEGGGSDYGNHVTAQSQPTSGVPRGVWLVGVAFVRRRRSSFWDLRRFISGKQTDGKK